jgi:hypothetical protein
MLSTGFIDYEATWPRFPISLIFATCSREVWLYADAGTLTFATASDVSLELRLNFTSATLLPEHAPHPAECYQPE